MEVICSAVFHLPSAFTLTAWGGGEGAHVQKGCESRWHAALLLNNNPVHQAAGPA